MRYCVHFARFLRHRHCLPPYQCTVSTFHVSIDCTVQKKKMTMEIKINTRSEILSLVVFAIKFRWIRAGKKSASGAQSKEPTRPRNLSILSARQVARMMAKRQTRKREKFCIQYSVLDFFFRQPQSQLSSAVFVG